MALKKSSWLDLIPPLLSFLALIRECREFTLAVIILHLCPNGDFYLLAPASHISTLASGARTDIGCLVVHAGFSPAQKICLPWNGSFFPIVPWGSVRWWRWVYFAYPLAHGWAVHPPVAINGISSPCSICVTIFPQQEELVGYSSLAAMIGLLLCVPQQFFDGEGTVPHLCVPLY